MSHDVVYGRIPVLECLKADRRKAHRLHLIEGGKNQNELINAAGDVPIEWTSRMELDYLTKDAVHQGVVLEAAPLPLVDLDTWTENVSGPQSLVVVLDSIEDPQNFGAIARSAVACGATALIFGKDRSAPISPAVLKAATGAMALSTVPL